MGRNMTCRSVGSKRAGPVWNASIADVTLAVMRPRGSSPNLARICIRPCGSPDRDPATAGRLLQGFRGDLKTSCVRARPERGSEGLYGIAGCAGAIGSTSEGWSGFEMLKAITQIPMGQWLDGVEVQAGAEVRRLQGRASKKDALQAMAEIKHVAQDIMRRLDANFSDNVLYLGSWSQICRIAAISATALAFQETPRWRMRLGPSN